jgi:proteic killer suppression protein
MLGSIKHRGLRLFSECGDARYLNPEHVERLDLILGFFEAATTLEILRMQSTLRLHKLTGQYKGYWAVTIRANWRVVFHFKDGLAFDIDIVDYHGK